MNTTELNTTELNAEQRAAVASTATNTLVIAGPGSGKTRVLVERALMLAEQHEPQNVVVITYTNAAADEIAKRVEAAIDEHCPDPDDVQSYEPPVKLAYCGTLHGYMLRLLERQGSNIGLTSKIVVMDEERASSAFEEHAEKLAYKGTKQFLEAARSRFMRGGDINKFSQGADLVVGSWFGNMLTTGAFDFDGILHWGLQLLERCFRDSPRIHLLVDEAQDMAAVDMAIYHALPCASRFVVGDPDQAIFEFRGGDASLIVGLANNPGWQVFKLQSNYRCAVDICIDADRLIQRNAKRVHKAMLPTPTAKAGIVEHWLGLPTSMHEQRAIAEDIRMGCEPLPEGHFHPDNPVGQKITELKDCAVLLRTNALVEEYAKVLESYSIPVARRKERERPRDWNLCKAALAALTNPENDAALLWLIELKNGPEAAKQTRLHAASERRSVNQCSLQLKQSGPFCAIDWLPRLGIGPESIAQAREALLVSETIADALLTLAQEDRASVTTGDGVTVCTMHAAKGREFRTVYLPAFEQAIIPGVRKRDPVNEPEERRLAFVAVTRAADRLVISWVNERKPDKWSPLTAAEPSQFVNEMEGK